VGQDVGRSDLNLRYSELNLSSDTAQAVSLGEAMKYHFIYELIPSEDYILEYDTDCEPPRVGDQV
jgi:hypothetical protein